MASATPEKVDGDVERGSGDIHLYNSIIHTLYFEKVTVKTKDKKLQEGKLLLDSLDGAAYAGLLTMKPVPTLSI